MLLASTDGHLGRHCTGPRQFAVYECTNDEVAGPAPLRRPFDGSSRAARVIAELCCACAVTGSVSSLSKAGRRPSRDARRAAGKVCGG